MSSPTEPIPRFCNACGNPLSLDTPPGDNRVRSLCKACGFIHYQNPRLVVGALPVWEDRILLCRRAIEPRYGKWTLPAGFMENGETVAAGAIRETIEEAGARIELGPLFSMISVPHIHQVHVFYRARLLDLDFSPGDESLEVQLFTETDIPWDELAFRTVSLSLRRFFADRAAGHFQFHTEDLLPPGQEAALKNVARGRQPGAGGAQQPE